MQVRSRMMCVTANRTLFHTCAGEFFVEPDTFDENALGCAVANHGTPVANHGKATADRKGALHGRPPDALCAARTTMRKCTFSFVRDFVTIERGSRGVRPTDTDVRTEATIRRDMGRIRGHD